MSSILVTKDGLPCLPRVVANADEPMQAMDGILLPFCNSDDAGKNNIQRSLSDCDVTRVQKWILQESAAPLGSTVTTSTGSDDIETDSTSSIALTEYSGLEEEELELDSFKLRGMKIMYLERLVADFHFLPKGVVQVTGNSEIGSQGNLAECTSTIAATASSVQKTDGKLTRKSTTSGEDWDKDEQDEEDNRPNPSRRQGESNSSGNGKLFACPFFKWNPSKYRRCGGLRLNKVARVKYHLHRDKGHQMPIYCSRCFQIFSNERMRDNHGQLNACEVETPILFDGITIEQREQLNQRTNQKNTAEQNWFHIYGILFPNDPLPDSPYIDDSFAEELIAFREHELLEGPRIWAELLASHLPQELREHEESLTQLHRSLFPDATEIIYERWKKKNVETAQGKTGKRRRTSHEDEADKDKHMPDLSFASANDPRAARQSGTSSDSGLGGSNASSSMKVSDGSLPPQCTPKLVALDPIDPLELLMLEDQTSYPIHPELAETTFSVDCFEHAVNRQHAQNNVSSAVNVSNTAVIADAYEDPKRLWDYGWETYSVDPSGTSEEKHPWQN
jgi:hypothetical protein